MAVGQYKIGAILQARLGSTRLPNKVLMPLPLGSNSTIISQVIDSLKKVDVISEIVVATSKSAINDKLERYAKDRDMACFRGKEDDVLSRFYEIVKIKKFDCVIRFTADNPIIDINFLQEFINNFKNKDLDYSCTNNLPLGCNFEIMKSEQIVLAKELANTVFDKEHVTPYIKRTASKIEFYKFENYKPIDNLRLTIDYPSDYAFIQLLYAMLKNKAKTLKNIDYLVSKKAWLLEINKNNFQKKEYNNLKEEITELLPIIKERGLSRLEKRLNIND
tara:strand:- start:596 stop:1423 length:828 start_codon:yes stop_codon:yes gene_type:complete